MIFKKIIGGCPQKGKIHTAEKLGIVHALFERTQLKSSGCFETIEPINSWSRQFNTIIEKEATGKLTNDDFSLFIQTCYSKTTHKNVQTNIINLADFIKGNKAFQRLLDQVSTYESCLLQGIQDNEAEYIKQTSTVDLRIDFLEKRAFCLIFASINTMCHEINHQFSSTIDNLEDNICLALKDTGKKKKKKQNNQDTLSEDVVKEVCSQVMLHHRSHMNQIEQQLLLLTLKVSALVLFNEPALKEHRFKESFDVTKKTLSYKAFSAQQTDLKKSVAYIKTFMISLDADLIEINQKRITQNRKDCDYIEYSNVYEPSFFNDPEKVTKFKSIFVAINAGLKKIPSHNVARKLIALIQLNGADKYKFLLKKTIKKERSQITVDTTTLPDDHDEWTVDAEKVKADLEKFHELVLKRDAQRILDKKANKEKIRILRAYKNNHKRELLCNRYEYLMADVKQLVEFKDLFDKPTREDVKVISQLISELQKLETDIHRQGNLLESKDQFLDNLESRKSLVIQIHESINHQVSIDKRYTQQIQQHFEPFDTLDKTQPNERVHETNELADYLLEVATNSSLKNQISTLYRVKTHCTEVYGDGGAGDVLIYEATANKNGKSHSSNEQGYLSPRSHYYKVFKAYADIYNITVNEDLNISDKALASILMSRLSKSLVFFRQHKNVKRTVPVDK